jgi:hypothetical protein
MILDCGKWHALHARLALQTQHLFDIAHSLAITVRG